VNDGSEWITHVAGAGGGDCACAVSGSTAATAPAANSADVAQLIAADRAKRRIRERRASREKDVCF
jgi:hypothetical protein